MFLYIFVNIDSEVRKLKSPFGVPYDFAIIRVATYLNLILKFAFSIFVGLYWNIKWKPCFLGASKHFAVTRTLLRYLSIHCYTAAILVFRYTSFSLYSYFPK